jgi:hypothetical protein
MKISKIKKYKKHHKCIFNTIENYTDVGLKLLTFSLDWLCHLFIVLHVYYPACTITCYNILCLLQHSAVANRNIHKIIRGIDLLYICNFCFLVSIFSLCTYSLLVLCYIFLLCVNIYIYIYVCFFLIRKMNII